jgi:hypothetical protein
MDRATLRDVIRRKLDDGDLPTKAPNEMDVGRGTGATCDACGDPIQPAQSEHELTYPDIARVLRLHFGCVAVWEMQRRERGLDPAF